MDLRGAVFDRLRALPGAQEGESAFVDGPGFWAGGTEVAHLDARWDGAVVVDVRLTRAAIRARRAELREDPRIALRPSPSSDWLEFAVREPGDTDAAVALVADAVAAHAPPAGAAAPPPPSGPDLDRRRRWH